MTERVRWQYAIANVGMFGTAERLQLVLGKLGAAGWELVQVVDKASNWFPGLEKGFALFKRAVLDGEEPEGAWSMAVDRSGNLVAPEVMTTEIVW